MSAAERILLIEDEKLIRMTLRELLEDEGYKVHEAENGADGLGLLRSEDIDLVLLDYRLPDTDGIQVLRQIRTVSPETAVILVTAHSSIGSVVEAIKLGAYDYLDKPINQDTLLATIVKALETTRLASRGQAAAGPAEAELRRDQHHRPLEGDAAGLHDDSQGRRHGREHGAGRGRSRARARTWWPRRSTSPRTAPTSRS